MATTFNVCRSGEQFARSIWMVLHSLDTFEVSRWRRGCCGLALLQGWIATYAVPILIGQ
jgi:hypothetical protein